MLSVTPRRVRARRSDTTSQSVRPSIETLEGRTLLSATDPVSVLIGGAAARAVQFTDAGGTRATVRLIGGGNAMVTFDGTNLSQGVNSAAIVVNGTGVTLSSIVITASNLSSTLQIVTSGRGSITAGPITSDGAMAAIFAPAVVVNGNITVGASIHQVVLAGAENGTITIGSSRVVQGVYLSLGSADNESLNSSIRVSSLSCGQWLDTNNVQETVTAPQVLAVNSRGGFAPDLSVPGVQGAVFGLSTFFAGAIVGGTWTIGGDSIHVQTGSISGDWTATFGGKLTSLTIAHDATLNLAAQTIGALVVGGSLSDSTITLNQPLAPIGNDLNLLSVGGGIVSTTVRSSGNIGSIVATRMQDSRVYAGLVPLAAGQTLPAAQTDFANVAQINSLTLRRSASASFSGSDIAAYQLGSLVLGAVATANGGTPFGIAAHTIKVISLVDQTSHKAVREVSVPSSAAFSSLLASRGITQGDLVANVL